jgi:hypothetical protein
LKIQVNSDNTVAVDTRLASFVEEEAGRALGRFAARLTRVEVHLSDVDKAKTGKEDKVCLVEVRPSGARPLSASAQSRKMATAISGALAKMRRALTTFFGKLGQEGSSSPAAARRASKRTSAKEASSRPAKKTAVKETARKTAPKKPASQPATGAGARGPKKKGIYRARRKAWPNR